jgi:hypothetical protein
LIGTTIASTLSMNASKGADSLSAGHSIEFGLDRDLRFFADQSENSSGA